MVLSYSFFNFFYSKTHNYLHCSYSTYNTTLNTYSTYDTTFNTYSTYNKIQHKTKQYNTYTIYHAKLTLQGYAYAILFNDC